MTPEEKHDRMVDLMAQMMGTGPKEEPPKPKPGEFQYVIEGRNDGGPQSAKQWIDDIGKSHLHKRDEFIEEAIAALEPDPKGAPYRAHLKGVILQHEFELPKAADAFRALIRDGSTPVDCRELASRSLAECLTRMGDFRAAIDEADDKVGAVELCRYEDCRDAVKYLFSNYPDVEAPDRMVAEYLARQHYEKADYGKAVDVIEKYQVEANLLELYRECLGRAGRSGELFGPSYEGAIESLFVNEGLDAAINFVRANIAEVRDQHLLIAKLFRSSGRNEDALNSYVEALEIRQDVLVAVKACKLLTEDPHFKLTETPKCILKDCVNHIAHYLIRNDRWGELTELLDLCRADVDPQTLGYIEGAISINELDFDRLRSTYLQYLAPDPDNDDHELSDNLPISFLELAHQVGGMKKLESVVAWMEEVYFPLLGYDDSGQIVWKPLLKDVFPDQPPFDVSYPREQVAFVLFSQKQLSSESVAAEFARVCKVSHEPFRMKNASDEVWCVQWQTDQFAFFSEGYPPRVANAEWTKDRFQQYMDANPNRVCLKIDLSPGRTFPCEFLDSRSIQPSLKQIAKFVQRSKDTCGITGILDSKELHLNADHWCAKVFGEPIKSECLWNVECSGNYGVERPWTHERARKRFDKICRSKRCDAESDNRELSGQLLLDTQVEVLSAELVRMEGRLPIAKLNESSQVDSRLVNGATVRVQKRSVVKCDVGLGGDLG